MERVSKFFRAIFSLDLWSSIFGWRVLFRWDVLGALVPGVFLAVGVGMMGVDWFPHNLLISQICFGVCGALCLAKTIGHAVQHEGSTRRHKVVFCVLICGAIIAVDGTPIWTIQSHRHKVDIEVARNSGGEDRPTLNPTPAPAPKSSSSPTEPKSPSAKKPVSAKLPPSVSMRFFVQAGELRFAIWNGGDETAQNPKYSFGLADFTNQYYPHYKSDPDSSEPLPIPTNLVNDYVKPHVGLGNFAVLNDLTMQYVKPGDKLFGMATISCMNCPGDRTIWLYWEVGHGGWIAPFSHQNIGNGPFKGPSLSNEQIDFWLSKFVHPNARIPILPMPQ